MQVEHHLHKIIINLIYRKACSLRASAASFSLVCLKVPSVSIISQSFLASKMISGYFEHCLMNLNQISNFLSCRVRAKALSCLHQVACSTQQNVIAAVKESLSNSVNPSSLFQSQNITRGGNPDSKRFPCTSSFLDF